MNSYVERMQEEFSKLENDEQRVYKLKRKIKHIEHITNFYEGV